MNLKNVMELADKYKAPVIISYDREDTIAYEERNHDGSELIEQLEGFNGYKLTNRIRLNSELSAFITRLMNVKGSHRRDFPSVSVAYAADDAEARTLLKDYLDQDYIHIYDDAMNTLGKDRLDINVDAALSEGSIEVNEATCREFNGVVMLIDDSFVYAENGCLRSISTLGDVKPAAVAPRGDEPADSVSVVRNLFHGLSRAKEKIAIVVRGNKPVFEVILGILQGENPRMKKDSL
jgi:hypothetical protein